MGKITLKIRGLEISVDDYEELDKLIARYGTQGDKSQGPAPTVSDSAQASLNLNKDGSPSSMDRALLKRFIESDREGVLSKQLALSLGAHRKAVQVGLNKWAQRLGLWQGTFAAVFEKFSRPEGRGYRLTKEAIQAGKDILVIG